MSTVKIYRVETIDGTGPYRIDSIGQLATFICLTHSNIATHPPITVDFNENQWKEEKFCGFNNLDQLFNWFGDVIDVITGKGFYISEYVCRRKYIDNGKSGKQIMFVKSKAYLTAQIEI